MDRNFTHWLFFRGINYWSSKYLWGKTVMREHQPSVCISARLHPFPAVPVQESHFPLYSQELVLPHATASAFRPDGTLGPLENIWALPPVPKVMEQSMWRWSRPLCLVFLTCLCQAAISKSPALTLLWQWKMSSYAAFRWNSHQPYRGDLICKRQGHLPSLGIKASGQLVSSHKSQILLHGCE